MIPFGSTVRPARIGVRGIQVYRAADRWSGWLLLSMLVASPWLFGTTQPSVIAGMNWAGAGLWLLLAIKWSCRGGAGYRPARWQAAATPVLVALFLLTVFILTYMLISAVNARAGWQPEAQTLVYRDCWRWLPHSYCQQATWQALANYGALAGFFWALWDWLQGLTSEEERETRREFTGAAGTAFPARLRLLLWVVCLNGGLLALEGIIQRQTGTNKLLWLVVPRVNQDAATHFGPYAYRANGAQFLNLLWPVALGFWWTLQRTMESRQNHLVLVAAGIMAAGPFVSTARGGALIAGGMLVAVGLLMAGFALLLPRSNRSRSQQWPTLLGVMLFFGFTLLLVRNFGWENLSERMTQLDAGLENREAIYDTARQLAQDYRWFGTGAGSLVALFPLYRSSPDEFWPAQLHNDWLEMRITFGWLGFGLWLLALALVLARWWSPGGIHGGRRFIALLWLALAGVLVHARFDFPFQIYSLLMVVLMHAALLLSMSRRSAR